MASNKTHSVIEIVVLIEKAIGLLTDAEGEWSNAVESEFEGAKTREILAIEELLHVATHETASTLAFAVQDLHSLLARLDVRAKYKMFSGEQFDRIVSQGWSTSFVKELHKQHPNTSLVELSVLVKEICAEWGRLRKVVFCI